MEEMNFKSMEEILEFAIKEESDAGVFYGEQAKKTTNIELKMVWEQLAHDEIRHKAILSGLLEKLEKGDESITFASKDVSNYVPVDIPNKAYSDMEKAIIAAINNENDAYFMYKHLSEKVSNSVQKNVLQTLAIEELKHRDSLLVELKA